MVCFYRYVSGVLPGLVLALAASTAAHATDWITAPSDFTHDPVTGRRVTQHTPIVSGYRNPAPFQRSVYRNSRSSIVVGGSADRRHVVEEYGRPIRPYGEWQFPYRPYSVPYPAWGPPFGYVPNAFPGGFGGPFAGGYRGRFPYSAGQGWGTPGRGYGHGGGWNPHGPYGRGRGPNPHGPGDAARRPPAAP